MNEIYLDNSTTSFQKPSQCLEEIKYYLDKIQASPYRENKGNAGKATKFIEETRQMLAQSLGLKDYQKLCFTSSATESLNTIIKGFLRQGDHVLISNFEHNAVLRPLHALSQNGLITFDVFESDSEGFFDLAAFESSLKSETKLVILSHASNVLGAISPLQDIGKILRRKGIALCVDCAQSAGHLPIDVEENGIDMLAGTAHKSLLGPPGVGFLCS